METKIWTAARPLEDPFERLHKQLAGDLLYPGATGYEAARTLWNGMIDRRPAAISRCTSAADVRAAVLFAAETGIPLAVRGGGHSISGASSCDAGLVIDLTAMKRVDVDPQARIARADPGVLLGAFDMATQAHGLATTMGVNSDTGIAGLTLGGGLGRLRPQCRPHLRQSAGRGGRAGGRAHCPGERGRASRPVLGAPRRRRQFRRGHVVRIPPASARARSSSAGMLLWELRPARDAMQQYAEFCAAAPDDVDALGVLLTGPDGGKLFAVSCFLRRHGGAWRGGAAPLCARARCGRRRTRWRRSPTLLCKVQRMRLFPRSRRYYWKSHFLPGLSDTAIDTLLDRFAQVPSPMSVIGLQQTGGAIARVPGDATAYANRDAAFDCIPIAIWEDSRQDAANIAWSRSVWKAMRPFSTGGVYVNNLGDEGEERVHAAYGRNWERLAAVKAAYDPNNLFRLNQNIRPGARAV